MMLLALCEGNSPVTGEFPSQRPVTRSFDVFFDLHLNKRLSKQSRQWLLETLSRSWWRHCNEVSIKCDLLDSIPVSSTICALQVNCKLGIFYHFPLFKAVLYSALVVAVLIPRFTTWDSLVSIPEPIDDKELKFPVKVLFSAIQTTLHPHINCFIELSIGRYMSSNELKV